MTMQKREHYAMNGATRLVENWLQIDIPEHYIS